MKNKKIILIISIIVILLLTVGVSLAAYTYTREGSSQELVLGDIYMHYTESNELVLDNAMPYEVSYTVNPDMASQTYEQDTRNELSKCVDSFSDWNFYEGEDPESFCKGTGTIHGYTFQKCIGEEWFYYYDDSGNYYDYGYEFLTSNNIITSDNLVNPIMQNQIYEKDTRNELSNCVDSFSDSNFYDGEDSESFCKGTGTKRGNTFQYYIDNEEFYYCDDSKNYYDYGYEFLTNNNIIVSNYYDLPYFEFTISGKNTYTEKDIWYEIVLNYGDNNETRNTRIKDDLLKFTLVEIKDGAETKVIDNKSYSDLQNKRIYVNTIEKNTTSEVNVTYRLYMWISSDIVIGNVNQDYTIDEWKDVYASIKVKVSGDFIEKKANEKPLEEKLIAKAVSYSVASSDDFAGGLVAINTDGTLYDETDSQQEIREYRYTGLDVNNYIFLDTDGDSEQDENEIWRIVGIFKNSEGEWNLKLMRNTLLTSDEIPETYTYNGTSYKLKPSSTSQYAYWNYTNTATNDNDWTTAKLQYWLNASDGYYGTLSNNIQKIIDTNYKYYLGNSNFSTDTTVLSYTAERNESNIWSGNSATWNGSIALLYPSDYGYSANSSYWSYLLNNFSSQGSSAPISYRTSYTVEKTVNNEVDPNETSWMKVNANNSLDEWFISPSSVGTNCVAEWSSYGKLDYRYSISSSLVRPVLNLIANFGSLSGSGIESNPYVLS